MDQFFIGSFWEIFIKIYAIEILRYLFFAGIAFGIFYVWMKVYFASLKIQNKPTKTKDMIREIKYSFFTFICFAIVASIFLGTEIREGTLIYNQVSDRGWGYIGLSLVGLVLYHDAYFYWTHRWMHHPNVMKWVHKVHHLSHSPTPWAAFSFHPLEAIVQSGVIVTAVFLFPLHPVTIFLFLIIMTAYNVYEHLGYEIVPKKYDNHWFWKWFTRTTHHDFHHEKGHGNYGLYFTFWDRLMKTKR